MKKISFVPKQHILRPRKENPLLVAGNYVAIWWEDYLRWYRGTIVCVSVEVDAEGTHDILYDDGHLISEVMEPSEKGPVVDFVLLTPKPK